MEKVTNPNNPVVFFDVSIGNTVCKIQMSVVISTVFNIFYLSDVIIIVFIKRDAVRISLFYINKIRNQKKTYNYIEVYWFSYFIGSWKDKIRIIC